jgi:hypothetical protein
LTFYVNLGDHMDMRSLNHHMLDRGEPTQVDVANECGKANYVLQMMAQWASERHIIIGNHGRFIEDFAKKNPQLLGLLNFHALSGAEMAGYNVLEEKAILSRGPSKFCHGEIRMFGATGDKHYKMQQVMQAETMFGHTHTPTCRCGCYSVGLLGQLDQDYNEVEASQWVHGFGLAYVYEGESFMTSIPILGHALTLGNRTFVPGTGVAKWVPPEFEAQVIYRQKI